MSYNWQSAATEQGRERLKELAQRGIDVIAYFGNANKYMDVSFEDGTYFMDHEEAFDSIEELVGDDTYFRFLDPEPTAPVVDENGLLPCPFCGGNDIDMYPIGKRAYEIKCKTFGCVTTRKVGVITQSIDWAKDRCIERWNTRSGKPLTGRGIEG